MNRFQGIESYVPTFFRPRQDGKSIIPDTVDPTSKVHPQLVHMKRIPSVRKQISTPDDFLASPVLSGKPTSWNKNGSQTSLMTTSSTFSSISSLFKVRSLGSICIVV